MTRPRTNETGDLLKGVERAVHLLRQFTPTRLTLDLTATSRHLNVPRSTAHRLLRTLEAGGLLVYDPERRTYRLSLAVAHLGQVALATVDLRTAARPYLRRLVAETGESVFLLVVQDLSAVVIDVQESDLPLRLTFPVGTPWPLHAGASNRVLLAHLSPDDQAAYLRRPLVRITPATIVDPEVLAAELARVRRRGYAYSVGELTPGVTGVAIPLLSVGRLLGALTVAGPASRLPASRVPDVVRALKAAATDIVTNLEGRAGQGAYAQRQGGWRE